jgi:hypothetical protein
MIASCWLFLNNLSFSLNAQSSYFSHVILLYSKILLLWTCKSPSDLLQYRTNANVFTRYFTQKLINGINYMSSIPNLKTILWQFQSHVQEHLHNWLIQKVILKWHNTEDKSNVNDIRLVIIKIQSDIFHISIFEGNPDIL